MEIFHKSKEAGLEDPITIGRIDFRKIMDTINDAYWDEVEEMFKSIPLENYRKVRIYQDTLPKLPKISKSILEKKIEKERLYNK